MAVRWQHDGSTMAVQYGCAGRWVCLVQAGACAVRTRVRRMGDWLAWGWACGRGRGSQPMRMPPRAGQGAAPRRSATGGHMLQRVQRLGWHPGRASWGTCCCCCGSLLPLPPFSSRPVGRRMRACVRAALHCPAWNAIHTCLCCMRRECMACVCRARQRCITLAGRAGGRAQPAVGRSLTRNMNMWDVVGFATNASSAHGTTCTTAARRQSHAQASGPLAPPDAVMS